MTQDRTPSAELVALLHRIRTRAGRSTFVLSDPAAMKLIDAYAAQVSAERVKAERERVVAAAREILLDEGWLGRSEQRIGALTDDTAPQAARDETKEG